MKILAILAWVCFSSTAFSQTVATVNGKSISVKELNDKMDELRRQFPGRQISKSQLLEDMVKRELGIQEAKRIGLQKKPEVIEQMETVLFQALIEIKVGEQVKSASVSNADAKAFYEKNKEIRISQIFVRLPSNAEAADKKNAAAKVKEIRAALASGQSFSKVAQKFSEGMEAPAGGDLDYRTRNELEPNLYNAAIRLPIGGISPQDIVTPYGIHIIRLAAVKEWSNADKGKIKRLALQDLQKKAFETYINGLRQKGKVSINQKLL